MTGADEPIDLEQLALAWRQHVDKIAQEIGLDARAPEVIANPRVWGAHDLAAALYIRDRVEQRRTERPDQGSAVSDAVTRADTAFRSITREDQRGLLGRLVDEDITGRGWWWHRVPRSGPIAEELKDYYGD